MDVKFDLSSEEDRKDTTKTFSSSHISINEVSLIKHDLSGTIVNSFLNAIIPTARSSNDDLDKVCLL